MQPGELDTQRERTLALALALVCVLAYLQVIVGGFEFLAYDDPEYVSSNPRVLSGLSLDNLIWAFTEPYFSNWAPVTLASYMLDASLFGPESFGFHFTQVVLHAATSVLVFRLLRTLSDRPKLAWIAALIFALHPVHAGTVAWISCRKDLLSAFFALASMLAYVRYSRARTARGWAVVTGLFALALMSKATVAPLPFVYLLIDAQGADRAEAIGSKLLEKLPWLVMALLVAMMTTQAQGDAITFNATSAPSLRAIAAAWAYANSLGLLLWPTGLSIHHQFAADLVPMGLALSIMGALLLVTALAARAFRTRPGVLLGWLCFCGLFLPVSGFVAQLGEQAFAERYLYLSSVGLLWSAVSLVAGTRADGRGATIGGIALALTAFGALQVGVSAYASTRAAWEHALEVTENNAVAHLNYGALLHAEGDSKGARVHFLAAHGLVPTLPHVAVNLGLTFIADGELARAAYCFELELARDPNSLSALEQLGWAELRRDRPREAERAFAAALRVDGTSMAALLGLGQLLARGSDVARLEAHYQAVSRTLDHSDVGAGLALAMALRGRSDEARGVIGRVLAAAPESPFAHYARARVLASTGGSVEEIAAAYEDAARLDPHDAHYRAASQAAKSP